MLSKRERRREIKSTHRTRTFDRALLILSVAPTLSAIVQCKFMAVLLAGRLRSALGVGTTGPAKDRLKAFRSSASSQTRDTAWLVARTRERAKKDLREDGRTYQQFPWSHQPGTQPPSVGQSQSAADEQSVVDSTVRAG